MMAYLNPRYTFSNFVTGKSNSLACYACLEMLKSPGMSYNPLFIWGETGTGKTHLINASGHEALNLNPAYKVIYVTAEMFINEMIDAIKERKTSEFRNKYRTTDILLMDGLDFLNHKEGTQEEFFHTLNHLYNVGKKIIITSYCPPKELKFNKSLISRLISGLVVNIKSPDLDMRKAIIRKKIDSENIQMPDDVIEYIGNIESQNVRELEGLIAKIGAYSSLKKEKIDLVMAKEVLEEFNPVKEEKVEVISITGFQTGEDGLEKLIPVEILSKTLSENLTGFMKDLRKIAASVPEFHENFEMDKINFSLNVNSEGNFSLTGEVSAGNNGGIRIVFKKKPFK